jgi:uncharacterized membrane protein SpoIIM required for sporulation
MLTAALPRRAASTGRPPHEPNLRPLDIDGFIDRNQPTWQRLADRTGRAHRGVRRLGPGELDQLVADYQRTSAHLSYARTAFADPGLTSRLTRLVADANGVIYGKRNRTLSSIGRFFAVTFPAAVWYARRFVLVSALLMVVPAVAVGAWIGTSDEALDAAAPDAVREAYLDEGFEAYYSSEPAAQFATEVTVNNIQVSILAFAAGIAFCLGAGYVLILNGANLGVAAGLFVAAGQSPKFFGLILPHGLLELTAISLAAAAGIQMGWALIAPGDRTRGDAVAEEGRRSVVIVLGLALAFIVAGTIEGIVTGSGLSTLVRVGIGVTVEIGFVLYVVVQGRRAAAMGETGLLGPRPPTWGDEWSLRRSAPTATSVLSPSP